MEYKYILGGALLQIDNPYDAREVIFVDKQPWEVQNKEHTSIPFYNMVINRFLKGQNASKDGFKSLYLFELSAPFGEEENYPFNYFNIFEHKNIWIKQLKGYINHPDTEKRANRGIKLPRIFYRLLYQYYMIIENTHQISDEAMVNVQKIHDLQMPSSYFYELKDLINSLEVPEVVKEESNAV